jgi:hypothetical protein
MICASLFVFPLLNVGFDFALSRASAVPLFSQCLSASVVGFAFLVVAPLRCVSLPQIRIGKPPATMLCANFAIIWLL